MEFLHYSVGVSKSSYYADRCTRNVLAALGNSFLLLVVVDITGSEAEICTHM